MTVVVTIWPQCYNNSHSGSVLSTPSHTTQRNLCNLSERTYVLRRTCMIWRRLRTKFILFIGIVLQWSSSIWLYISPKMRFWSPSILAFPFVLVWAEQQPELPGESILNLYLPLPSNWSNTPTAAPLILQSITIEQYLVKVLEISSLCTYYASFFVWVHVSVCTYKKNPTYRKHQKIYISSLSNRTEYLAVLSHKLLMPFSTNIGQKRRIRTHRLLRKPLFGWGWVWFQLTLCSEWTYEKIMRLG